jgi:hypothetical protein
VASSGFYYSRDRTQRTQRKKLQAGAVLSGEKLLCPLHSFTAIFLRPRKFVNCSNGRINFMPTVPDCFPDLAAKKASSPEVAAMFQLLADRNNPKSRSAWREAIPEFETAAKDAGRV